MPKYNIDFDSSGPPDGVSRRGRWSEVHIQVGQTAPGVWTVISGLDKQSAQSMRSSLVKRNAEVHTRLADDGTTTVWVLREAISPLNVDPSVPDLNLDVQPV